MNRRERLQLIDDARSIAARTYRNGPHEVAAGQAQVAIAFALIAIADALDSLDENTEKGE